MAIRLERASSVSLCLLCNLTFRWELTKAFEIGQYSVGDSFLAGVGISFSTRGRDLGIFICYIVFNALVTLLAARFLS